MTTIECAERSIEDERKANKRAYQKAWREKNKEKRQAYQSEYTAANKEKKRLYDIEYRAENKDKCRAAQDAWRERNQEHLKVYHRDHGLKKYGLTQEDWDAMFATQGFRCATCFRDKLSGKMKWHTDHCHATGVVRGILCGRCNKALGLLDDNTSTLSNAISYLNRFKQ